MDRQGSRYSHLPEIDCTRWKFGAEAAALPSFWRRSPALPPEFPLPTIKVVARRSDIEHQFRGRQRSNIPCALEKRKLALTRRTPPTDMCN
jgi:hypothetical protein